MHDVICVGGSVAGATTAALLARPGRRVLILDGAHFPRDKACGQGILPHGVAVLDRLGLPLPEAVLTRGIRFRLGDAALDLGFPSGHGLAVRRRHLDQALRDHAQHRGAEIRRATVRAVEPGRVHTDRGSFAGRILVGADGRHSIFHRDCGLRITGSRRRLGLSTHLTGFDTVPDRVEVVCFPEGEIYLAPVGNGLTLAAFLVDRKLGLTPPGVLPLLRQLLPDRARDAALATPVHGAAPLSRTVDRITGPDWLLVGDSAGCLDPITGEGMSMALVGAEMAAEVVDRVLEGDGSLEPYARRFRSFQRPLARVTALVLLAARHPRLARTLMRHGALATPLMRLATGESLLPRPRLHRSSPAPAA